MLLIANIVQPGAGEIEGFYMLLNFSLEKIPISIGVYVNFEEWLERYSPSIDYSFSVSFYGYEKQYPFELKSKIQLEKILNMILEFQYTN
jgi:hypothetical protein